MVDSYQMFLELKHLHFCIDQNVKHVHVVQQWFK